VGTDDIEDIELGCFSFGELWSLFISRMLEDKWTTYGVLRWWGWGFNNSRNRRFCLFLFSKALEFTHETSTRSLRDRRFRFSRRSSRLTPIWRGIRLSLGGKVIAPTQDVSRTSPCYRSTSRTLRDGAKGPRTHSSGCGEWLEAA
jgi:hypothetical protein